MLEHLTDCECTEPGWCARHRCEKDRHFFEMCRRSAGWYQMWERRRIPGDPNSAVQRHYSREPCRHLGSEIRTVECPTCQGHVRLKVFSCDLHHECTLSPKLTDIINCVTCGDYQSV